VLSADNSSADVVYLPAAQESNFHQAGGDGLNHGPMFIDEGRGLFGVLLPGLRSAT